MVVDLSGKPTIIDAKWKRLKDESTLGVDQSDVYQMMAYSQAYESHRAALIYPWHRDIGAPPGPTQRWNICGTDRTLEVVTVDVGEPQTAVEQLKDILGAQLKQVTPAAA